MYYKKFVIERFKGIDKVEVDLERDRVVTLVGLNESGKTTVMQGIELYYRMARDKQPSTEQLKEFRPKGIDFSGNIVVGATLRLEDDDKRKIQEFWNGTLGKRGELDIPDEYEGNFHFIYETHKHKETTHRISFPMKKAGVKRSLHDSDGESWNKVIEFIRKDLIPEILYYEDFIFRIPEEISFVESNSEVEEKSDPTNQTWQLVIHDILKSVREELDFRRHVVDVWESDNDAAAQRVSQMERALNQKITERWAELFKSRRINFREIKIEPKYANDTLKLSFIIVSKDGKRFYVRERSKGFNWFFSFLLFTEFRKRRSRNILFLLDEPASNLHSSAQAKILDAIGELSKEAIAVYSTHSHHLINPEWLSGAYICINESLSDDVLEGDLNLDQSAKISATRYYTYVGQGMGSDKRSYFQPILDRLDYAPSELEAVPEIIILEGKNDWYTFNYFQRIILNKKKTLNLYPGAGKDKLDEIIRLYMAWGSNFVVLLDGDRGGEAAKKRYQENYGEYVQNRIFTLKDATGTSTATEGLLEGSDKEKLYDSIFGKDAYKKIRGKSKEKDSLNLAINQLLSNKKKLSLGGRTKTSVRAVLTFAEKKLREAK